MKILSFTNDNDACCAAAGLMLYFIVCRAAANQDGDIDYANTLHEIWRWPPETGEERCESFFELYESSIERAAELIQEAPVCRDFAILTENIPFA